MAASLTRGERQRLRHREEIMAAALELFARQGYRRTTIVQIAEHAEFAVATLYKFFSDKKTLYRAIIREAVQEYERLLLAALEPPGPPLEKLERYITTKAELFVRHTAAARLYFSQTAGAAYLPPSGFDAEVRAIYERMLSVLEDILREAIRSGIIREAEPRMLVMALEGLTNALVAPLVEHPETPCSERIAETALSVLLDGVRISNGDG